MIPIDKNPGEQLLSNLEQQRKDGRSWQSVDNKSIIRTALHTDQKGLCAYCMRLLSDSPETTRIDHFIPRTHDHSLELDYGNLLLSCATGANEKGKQNSTCDSAKGDKLLPARLNPATWVAGSKSPEFIFDPFTGKVECNDGQDSDASRLISVLRLDIASLRRERKNEHDEFLKLYEIGIAAGLSAEAARYRAIQAYFNKPLGVYRIPFRSAMIQWFFHNGTPQWLVF